MRSAANRRLTPLAVAIAVPALSALSVASQASAATIYACVNKRTGVARVFTHKPRCRRNETRLLWNTPGPAGRNGANGKNGATGKTGQAGKNGTNGTNGTNGAVNGYSAGKPEFTEFTGKEAVIVTRSLPAGSYILTAKTVVSATASAVPIRAAAVCVLLDGGLAPLDSAGWNTGLVEDSGKLIGETTLSLAAAVTLKATTFVSLACSDLSPQEHELKIGAAFSQIVAVQTALNS
ncbi:MAG TPA: hypothetical protein VK790_02725 [Solirubrobacteraceae bacterium]|jgi:hypothetical protein|nr:hypothetical protein [Solirubrobacteraceae bacterium]